MKRCILVLTTLIIVSLSDRAKAQGNLVFNGGFNVNTAGWTLTNGASYAYIGNPGLAVGLDNEIPSPSINPTASQTINSLTPATSYIVSGDFQKLKDRGGSAANPSFGVAIDGVFLFQAVAPSDANWHSFNFLYGATSSSALLSLSAQINGTATSYAIDNISIVAVPEPSTVALAIAGWSVLFYFRRGRKIKAEAIHK